MKDKAVEEAIVALQAHQKNCGWYTRPIPWFTTDPAFDEGAEKESMSLASLCCDSNVTLLILRDGSERTRRRYQREAMGNAIQYHADMLRKFNRISKQLADLPLLEELAGERSHLEMEIRATVGRLDDLKSLFDVIKSSTTQLPLDQSIEAIKAFRECIYSESYHLLTLSNRTAKYYAAFNRLQVKQENSDWGATAKMLAIEYERDEDTMRHHMKVAFREGLLRSADRVCDDEKPAFDAFMARPGKLRKPRKRK